MKLERSITLIIFSLFLLASCASLNPEPIQIMREGQIFQITRMNSRSAQFQFVTQKTSASKSKREVIEVIVGTDGDIKRAVVRKMIDVIRRFQKHDFKWESYRLDRVVTLSALMEDSKGLEDFLIREFFTDTRVFVDSSILREKRILGKVIAEGRITDEGTVREPVIVESNDPELEKVVIDAILKYRYNPLTLASKPVPGRYRETFDFGTAGIDERISKYDLRKKTDPPSVELQYEILPVVKVVAPVVYPFKLLQDNISGSAKVTVIVDPDGNVARVNILEATHPEFGLATRGMMQSWEFEPATKDGKEIWSIFALEQKFNRSEKGSPVSLSAGNILRNLKNHSHDIHSASALDSLPVALYNPLPAYPPDLAKDGEGDQVIIEFFIDEDGDVQLPRIMEAKNDELAWLALTALSRWRYDPPLREGRPVITRVRIPMNFSPSKKIDVK